MGNSVVAFAAVLAIFAAPKALAWGSYGHQQINRVALRLVQGSSGGAALGACLQKNANFIQRLAITPDYDWKNLGAKPSAELERLRLRSDHYEHPLHYFEADAFIKNSVTPQAITSLPSDDFEHAYSMQDKGGFPELFKANLTEIKAVNPMKLDDPNPAKRIDPENPTAVQVATTDGSAPWRTLQLYKLASDALHNGDFKMALMYMGAMGHYVGDMAQPFHASMNFDGDYYKDADGHWQFFSGAKADYSPAAGIHHSFEEAILEKVFADSLNAADLDKMKAIATAYCADRNSATSCVSSHLRHADPNNDLWLKFDATENQVLNDTNRKELGSPVGESQVVAEVLKLVAGGYGDIDPLLDTFAEVTKANPVKTVTPKSEDDITDEGVPPRPVSTKAIAAFVNAPVAGHGKTIELAEQRMADGAVLLARLWLGVVKDSGLDPARLRDCAELPENKIGADANYANYDSFRELVITNYPVPTYVYPALALRIPQSVTGKVHKKSKSHHRRKRKKKTST